MVVMYYRWKRILLLLLLVSLLVVFWSGFPGRPARRRHGDDDGPILVEVLHSDRDRGKKKKKVSASQIPKTNVGEEFLKNQKCNIPKLDINGEEVIGFFEKVPPLDCQIEGRIEKNWVTVDENGIIRFSEQRKSAKCKIQYFWRVDDDENEYGEKKVVRDGDEFAGSDFASVSCWNGFSRWNSLLWHLDPIPNAHERARKMKKEQADPEKKAYNVYFLGFDSLSQMSFRRKLPKTVEFLEKTLGSVVLNGYNIVGDGTPQAFIPILTAQTETELPLTRKRFPEAQYLDDTYPMVWKNFSDAGYVTMFGEDMHLYATFAYRLKGWLKQPTDHYPRTFFKDVEYRGDKTCLNEHPIHNIWFKNSRRFMKVYQDVPRFLLMHQGLLSHDDINLVGVEDDDVAAHLKHMNDEGLFDDSLVIVMADHGHRFAKLRETHQGQLEERMPFFSIALPKQLRGTKKGAEMEKNLRENAEKLTSPFDIHASLVDILNLEDVSDVTSMQDAASRRSLSVFRPIPADRTCAQAGIEAHWCTCLSWQNAMETPEDRRLTRRIASAVVREINKEIAVEKDLCAPLALAKIIDAKKLLPDKGLLAYKNVKDADGFVPDLSGSTEEAFAHYQLKLQTSPGNAIYEVTLFYDAFKNEMKLDFGAISHVNRYGDLPHCVIDRNFYIATFCVCFDKI